ncbi:MAG: hypothetical protein ABI234_20545, partial [Ktedonobacteraceae bacterium]
VDVLLLKKIFYEVESHGGTGTRISQYETFSMLLGKRTFCLCTFIFPEGTYREYGLTVVHATPFTITFPDGGVMQGTILVRPNTPAGVPPTTILHTFR